MNRKFGLVAVVLSVVIFGGFLRVVKLEVMPPGIYGDEAAIGYNAYSILKTGKDEYGTRLPLQFKSFNDYKAPLAIYLTVPFIKLFGLTTQAIRLPSALLGTLTILVTFWLGRSLFQSVGTGLAAAFFLALSPWHIHVSRAMFEANISLAFFLLGVALYVGTTIKSGKILAAVCLSLSLYAYHPAKLLAPLMALLLLVFVPTPRRLKVIYAVVFGLMAVPFLYNFLFGQGEAKFEQTVIFRPDYVRGEIARRVDEQRTFSQLPARFKPIVYNKPVELGKEFLRNYLKSYGTEFWYLYGEGNQTLNPGPLGLFYFWEWPLFYLGLYCLFAYQRRLGYLIGLWFLLAPLPAAVTGTTYVLRHLLLLPWPQLVEAYGLVRAGVWLGAKKRVVFWFLVPSASLMVAFSSALFLGHYFFTYGRKNASWWGHGEKEMIRLSLLNANQFNLFFLPDTASVPVTYAFFAQVEPAVYQQTLVKEMAVGEKPKPPQVKARQFGKVMVGSLLSGLNDPADLPEGTVWFLLPEQAPTLPPLFTINDPGDGRVLFKGYIGGQEYQPNWRFN